MPAPKGRRVQLDMPPKIFDLLNAIKDTTEAASYTDVLKSALKVYAHLLEAEDRGARIYSQEPGKAPVELVFI